ncbi:MAG: hemolysin family protein [Acidobacteriota bacterium]
MSTLIVIVLLVAVNAFFVGAEYAVVGTGRIRAQRLARERRFGARLLLSLLAEPRHLDRAITACQIGISASSMVLGAYGELVFAPRLARWMDGLGASPAAVGPVSVVLILAGVTALQAIVGEQVPKSIAVRQPSRWARLAAAPVHLCLVLFAPFIWILRRTAALALGVLGLPALPEQSLHSATEIDWMVSRSARAGSVDADLRRRLGNALRLASRRAQDVMEPRVSVRAVPEGITRAELRSTFSETGFTRLPVHRGSLDRIIGLVHAKDLLVRAGEDGDGIGDLVRPVPVVAWSTNAIDLIDTMRSRGATLAVVVDERGGTAGIVTIEDVIERVIGEIKDEFDATGPRLGHRPDGRIRLKADETLADINARHGLDLVAKEARTLGGLIMESLNRVARPGDRVDLASCRLVVERVHGRHIETVLVEPLRGGRAGGAS